MPAYGSQLTSNSPLVAVMPDQAAPVVLLNAETPVANAASIACVLAPRPTGQLTPVSVRFSCPLGIGAGVFQIQDADFDLDSEYTSIAFGGNTPGTVATAQFNAGKVSRVELTLRGRFLRVLCTTAPGNPITVTVE